MKKLIAFVLVLTIAFSMVGCFEFMDKTTTTEKQKYKLTLIDNFGLLNGEVEDYYFAGEEVRIYVKSLSSPLACINLNGVEFTHNDKQFDIEIGSEFYSFPMPAQDSIVYLTLSGQKEHTNVDCANGKHGWKMPVWSEDGTYRTVECAVCGYIEVRYIQKD